MKNILIGLVMFLSFSHFANAFQVITECSYDSFYGECAVVNDNTSVVNCLLKIEGQTRSGAFYRTHVNASLFPGQRAYVYVNATNGYIDPLVRVLGSADCH
jgi:hypothetical protein